ncbi:hypothetical protein HII31_06010 [Pseudocercospora fuligena]|uniref:Uncharacterized protein n=1 Tax=Pseudocercospora fuligena TaxID=685502 RepID=A0A8H6RM70_9PEZI|nr:hypothetical protein HII31_06010 [Pseudocercospora fuligena]
MRTPTEDFEVTAILHEYKYNTPTLHLPSSNLKARLPTHDFRTFTKGINNSTSLTTANIKMATLPINKDQLVTGGNRVFAQDFTNAANRSMTLPSSNKRMSYSQISQVQPATINNRVFGQDFTQAITGRAMTLPSTSAIMATLPINKDDLITDGQRVFAWDSTEAINSPKSPTSIDKKIFDSKPTPQDHAAFTPTNAKTAASPDQPTSGGSSGKRVFSCNSVIVCMSKLDAFETEAEKSYCEKHHIAEALEEIYHTAEKEQGGVINDKDRKKYSKRFRWGQFRKSPAYGHDHEKCDCGCCVRLGAYLSKVQATLAEEKGRRLGLWTVFTMRRQFGIKLNKKGLVRGRTGVAGREVE